MDLDYVYANLPYIIARDINKLVHYRTYKHVLSDLRTKVVRVTGDTCAFIVCNTENFYGVLAVLQ